MQVPQLRLALARCTPPVVASCSRPQMLVSQTWKVLARCTPPRAYSITGAGAAYTLTTCNGAPVSRRKGGQQKKNLAGHTNSASHLRQLASNNQKRQCLDEEVRARSAGTLDQLDYFSKLLDTTTKGDSIPPKFFSNCNDTLNGQRNASIWNRWKHTLAGRT